MLCSVCFPIAAGHYYLLQCPSYACLESSSKRQKHNGVSVKQWWKQHHAGHDCHNHCICCMPDPGDHQPDIVLHYWSWETVNMYTIPRVLPDEQPASLGEFIDQRFHILPIQKTIPTQTTYVVWWNMWSSQPARNYNSQIMNLMVLD